MTSLLLFLAISGGVFVGQTGATQLNAWLNRKRIASWLSPTHGPPG